MAAEEYLKDKTNYSGLRKFATVGEQDIVTWMDQFANEQLQKAKKEIESKIIDFDGRSLDGYQMAENDGLNIAIQILESTAK